MGCELIQLRQKHQSSISTFVPPYNNTNVNALTGVEIEPNPANVIKLRHWELHACAPSDLLSSCLLLRANRLPPQGSERVRVSFPPAVERSHDVTARRVFHNP
jgi:hypothetical protein